MKLVKGRLKYPLCIPSKEVFIFTANQIIKSDGRLVMGAGNALACKERYPEAPLAAGAAMKRNPHNRFNMFDIPHQEGMLGYFVTKKCYKHPSSMSLVEEATFELMEQAASSLLTYHLPFPGIGLGCLSRKDVLPVISLLPDNVIVYE